MCRPRRTTIRRNSFASACTGLVVRAPDAELLRETAALVRAAQRPLIISGGGVIYGEATSALRALAAATGLPVAETMAGKGAMRFDDPCALGAIGATGTPGANIAAREADLVIGIGTRWSDFTTASHTAFQNPDVQFININVARFDALKLGGLAVTADARSTIEWLTAALTGWEIDAGYRARVARFNRQWNAQVETIYHRDHEPLQPGRSHRRGERCGVRARRGRVRRGEPSWRSAQAVALSGAQELSRRVRLLVHGL